MFLYLTGSDYMGVDSSYEIEKVRGSLNSKYADRDLDSKHTAAENMKCKQLENNGRLKKNLIWTLIYV